MRNWKYMLLCAGLIGIIVIAALKIPGGLMSESSPKSPDAGLELYQEQTAGTQSADGSAGIMEGYAAKMHGLLADKLGMTWEQIGKAMKEGKSVAHIAEEKGLSKDELSEELFKTSELELEQLVAEGKLTNEQLAGMKVMMRAMITEIIEGGAPAVDEGDDCHKDGPEAKPDISNEV